MQNITPLQSHRFPDANVHTCEGGWCDLPHTPKPHKTRRNLHRHSQTLIRETDAQLSKQTRSLPEENEQIRCALARVRCAWPAHLSSTSQTPRQPVPPPPRTHPTATTLNTRPTEECTTCAALTLSGVVKGKKHTAAPASCVLLTPQPPCTTTPLHTRMYHAAAASNDSLVPAPPCV